MSNQFINPPNPVDPVDPKNPKNQKKKFSSKNQNYSNEGKKTNSKNKHYNENKKDYKDKKDNKDSKDGNQDDKQLIISNKKDKRYKKNFNKNYYPFGKFNNRNNNDYSYSQEFYFYIDPKDPTKIYCYDPNELSQQVDKFDSQDYNKKQNQSSQTNLLDFSNWNTQNNPSDFGIGKTNTPDAFKFSEQLEKNIFGLFNSINSHKLLDFDKPDKQVQQIENYVKKEFKWIQVPDIKTIRDLVELGKQWGTTWTDEYEYNINLKLINSLIPELEDLDLMIGLAGVKSQIIDLILFWALGLDNKNHDLLHTVIEGEPGTGKTELAEKLAKIYLKLGILKNNVFKKVKRSDLVAGYLGQTAIKTSKVIEECMGGVLFIDEAYSLGNAEGKDGKDSFSKECIDVLNQALTEHKSEFVCMIAGYSDDLAKSFFSYNSGLERRFPIRFNINPYSDNELGKIFVKKIKEYEWAIDVEEKELSQLIKSNRKYFKFNGGDMEILFAKCKISHSKNLLKHENKEKKVLDKKDIVDGIGLFLLNPEIKKREEEFESNKRLSYLYI